MTITKTMTFAKVQQIISDNDVSGFTHFLDPEKTWRYIVGITHNNNATNDTIAQQANAALTMYANVTIGGWVDTATGTTYIDVWFATDALDLALALGKFYDQIAIWDNKGMFEIRLK